MKTIEFNGFIKKINDRDDNSATLNMETPELTNEEFNALRDMKKQNLTIRLTPLDEVPTEEIKIDREAGEMTPSQELRWRIRKRWKENATIQSKYPDIDVYYKHTMRSIIDQIEI